MTPDRSARTGHFVVDAVGTFPVDLGDLDERSVLSEQPGDTRSDTVAAACHHRDPTVEEPVPVINARYRSATGHGDGH